MRGIISIAFCFSMALSNAIGQSQAGAGGYSGNSGQGDLSFTVGSVFFNGYSSNGFLVLEGIQQPYSGTELPVELIGFEGWPSEGGRIALHWSTASETSNAFFMLQRSSTGKEFSPLTKIQGKGDASKTSTYSFTDEKPYQGSNYYRLIQTDLNGKSNISKTIKIDLPKTVQTADAVSVYPNPVVSYLMVNMKDAAAKGLEIRLTNETGKTLSVQKATSDQTTIAMSSNPKGVYLLQVVSRTGVQKVFKIVKN